MRLRELPATLRDRIVSWEGNKKMSAALKVPKCTVFSIILKWEKFGTTRGVVPIGNQAQLIPCPIPSVVVAASCPCGVGQPQGLGNWSRMRGSWTEQSIEIALMKTWSRVLRISDWARSLPSNRTMTLSTQPRQRMSGLRGNSVNVLEWPSQSPDLNLIEHHCWGDSPSDSPYHNQTELERIDREEWQKIPNPGVQSLSRHTQEDLRLSALPKVLRLSTEYRVWILMSMWYWSFSFSKNLQ